jgi:hypothetical protein
MGFIVMKHSHKAMLFSAAIIPGAGQWINGQKRKSLIFMSLAIYLLAYLLIKFLLAYFSYIHMLMAGFDKMGLESSPIEQFIQNFIPILWKYGAAIIALWIIGMADAWFFGKKREKEMAS